MARATPGPVRELEMSGASCGCASGRTTARLWAPRYVANELAGTRQIAERHRQTAALRTAEAATATGNERAQLERHAVEAAALAATLDARAAELAIVDQARSRWLLHFAATRADADRAVRALGPDGGRGRPAARGDGQGVARRSQRDHAHGGPAPRDHRPR